MIVHPALESEIVTAIVENFSVFPCPAPVHFMLKVPILILATTVLLLLLLLLEGYKFKIYSNVSKEV